MRASLRILDTPLIERIVDEAFSILERQGVLIEDPHARERLAGVGLPADPADHRVRMSRATVEEALRTAPSGVTLHDRAGAPYARLEGDKVHFVPASSALRVLDRRTQEQREPTTADFIEYVKLAHGLKNISYLSTAFIPKDIPQDIADAWRLYLVMAHSPRPVVSGAFTAWGVPRMGEVMALVRGGREEVVARPTAIFTCCPNTPLRWGEDPIANLMDCAEWGIPVEVVPVLLLGMISPSTTVGAIVQHTAEVISGLTITQRVRPGTPVLFGGAPASFHMQLMSNPMTAVEALQMYCGYAQVAKHLNLPCQAYMALSDSKFNDPQAGMETGVGAFLAALAGFNSVSGPGMLDYVNCFSLEKLVFDDEVVAHAQRFIRPVEVQEDLPAGPLMEELVRDKHLLTSEHTLAHWPEELYLPGPMVDRTNWDQWEVQGSRDWRKRAGEVIDETLAAYEEEPLPHALHLEVQDLLRRTGKEPEAALPAVEEGEMIDYAVMNQLLFEGKHEPVKKLTEDALAEGRSALEVLDDGLIAGMRVVGEDFKHNRIFVPEVLLAARAMKAGMSVLKPLLTENKGSGASSVVIVMGTVKGDLHDIGKNLVGMMAEGAGFTIVDLGTDTSAERYIEAVREHGAQILGMSALLTTTMVYMRTVVQKMKEAGLGQVKICVGGAPVSQDYARAIGADGYAADAASAVELFKRLLGLDQPREAPLARAEEALAAVVAVRQD